jgi:TonB family protein
VVGGTGKVDPAVVAGMEGAVYAEGNPDVRYTAAALVHQVAPVYPPALRLAGIQGSVDARFVIDTLGIVEPASVEVLESTHAGFEAAAKQAVRSARFNPARLGDVRVRQLTRQRISFRLNQVSCGDRTWVSSGLHVLAPDEVPFPIGPSLLAPFPTGKGVGG